MAGIENNIVYGGGFKLTESFAKDILNMQRDATDVSRINHTGSPEGVISANPSSLCHDPVSGSVYVKATGTGNTGWQLVAVAGSKTVLSVAVTANYNIAINAVVPLDFPGVFLDSAGGWVTNTYTFQSSGNFKVGFCGHFLSNAGFNLCDVFLRHNGNLIYHGTGVKSASNPFSCVSNGEMLLPFAATDTLEVVIFCQTTDAAPAAAQGFAAGYFNTFTIEQV